MANPILTNSLENYQYQQLDQKKSVFSFVVHNNYQLNFTNYVINTQMQQSDSFITKKAFN